MSDEVKCGCFGKKTERPPETVTALVNRLKRIEGQVKGIIKMVENGAYCVDILTQSAAVSAAINSFNKELMAEHIRGCVTKDIRSGCNASTEELIDVLQKLMK